MNKVLIFSCVFLVSVLISSASQILLKKSADKDYDSPLKEYLNPLVITAYAMFFCSMLITGERPVILSTSGRSMPPRKLRA